MVLLLDNIFIFRCDPPGHGVQADSQPPGNEDGLFLFSALRISVAGSDPDRWSKD
jgi:hypothetical protein